LHTVKLIETGLGYGPNAKRCIEALASSDTVQDLDLGWNCFRTDVFKELGERINETKVLRSLGLANCSASVEDLMKDEKPTQFCSPVVFFVEALAHCKTLVKLDLSINRIDYRAVPVIEDSLEHNRVLTDLDVSYNPLGAYGMRGILRLLSRDSSGVKLLHTFGSCQGRLEPQADELLFSCTNPGGSYKLDFSRPEGRATLRLLYKACERIGVPAPVVMPDLRDCVMPRGQLPFAHPAKVSPGWWPLPIEGIFSARFDVAHLHEGQVCKAVGHFEFTKLMELLSSSAKVKIAPRKVAAVLSVEQNARIPG
jgi:hypothetical protein